MARIVLKSYEFRREREASWLELEALLSRIEKEGIRSLTPEQLVRLPSLYRATLSALSVARSISLDKNLLTYLENLAARAYLCVYGSRAPVFGAVRDFLLVRLPTLVRSARWHLFIAAACLFLGLATGWLLTSADPDLYYSLMPERMAQGRYPTTSTEDLRAVLYYESDAAAAALNTFATHLFTHNAGVGFFAFALGFALGVPVFVLLFRNGLTLGAMAALYDSRGLTLDFWGWILPHGVTEILAVALCGGAGLMLADALVFPGRYGRLESLAQRGRAASEIAIGAVLLFLIAGLIEGFFRQTVLSVPLRYALAIATAIGWGLYFGLAGRETSADDRTRNS